MEGSNNDAGLAVLLEVEEVDADDDAAGKEAFCDAARVGAWLTMNRSSTLPWELMCLLALRGSVIRNAIVMPYEADAFELE